MEHETVVVLVKAGETMRRPRAYLAHPMTTYGTEHEAWALGHVSVALSGWELLNPAAMYGSDTAWLRSWPRLVRSLDLLALAPAEDDTVGVGCIREVTDCLRWRVPVVVLNRFGHLCELRGLLLLGPDARTARRTAWAMVGEPSRLSDVSVSTGEEEWHGIETT